MDVERHVAAIQRAQDDLDEARAELDHFWRKWIYAGLVAVASTLLLVVGDVVNVDGLQILGMVVLIGCAVFGLVAFISDDIEGEGAAHLKRNVRAAERKLRDATLEGP